MASTLDALFAAAGDDEEVLRRAALIVELAKLKGAASVEAFGARFFFTETQPQSQPHKRAAVDDASRPPTASDTLAGLLARSPRGARCGPPLGFRPAWLALRLGGKGSRTQPHTHPQTPRQLQRATTLRSAAAGGGGGGGGGSDVTVNEENTGWALPRRPHRRSRNRNRNRNRSSRQGRRRRGIGSGSSGSSSGGGRLLRGGRCGRTPTSGGVLRAPRGITQRGDCRRCCRAPWRSCSALRALSFAASA